MLWEIRRAFRKQLQSIVDKYEIGAEVHYKRRDCHEWKGPGVVIGQGVVIFARCGGTYVRVHQSRLRKVDEPQVKMEETEEENQIKTDENLLKTPAVVLGEEHDFWKQTWGDGINKKWTAWYYRKQSFCDPVQARERGPTLSHSTTDIEGLKLKVGQIIKYIDKETGQTYAGKIISRAGKATGKHKVVQHGVQWARGNCWIHGFH